MALLNIDVIANPAVDPSNIVPSTIPCRQRSDAE